MNQQQPQPRRAERGKPILDLQPRDFDVLRGLFESRIMERRHLIALYFPDQAEYGKKRLQKLVAAGLIGERKRTEIPGHYLPSWIHLRRLGFDELARDPEFVRYPRITWEDMRERLRLSQSTVSHELGVIDGKVAWVREARAREGQVIEEYTTWPRLYELRTEHPDGSAVTLQPDAYIRMCLAGTSSSVHFFHEHDLGTEGLKRVLAKAYGYARYYMSGGFAVRMGGTPEDRKKHPFRVTIDVRNDERRNNVAEILLKDPLVHQTKNLFGLTTFKELTSDPLGKIWMTLGDYLAITKDTAYDPLTHTADRRVAPRDRLVAERLTKHSLFADRSDS